MPKKTLYFIRHGEASHNVPGHDQNEYNPGLTPKGKLQVKKVHGQADLIILSPLRRTKETLIHSNLQYKRILPSLLVREWTTYGPGSLLEEEKGAVLETQDVFMKRCQAAIALISSQPETTIAIVGHGVCLAQIVYMLGGIKKGFYNAEVFRMEIMV